MAMRWYFLALVILVPLASSVDAAQFYKWVDEQGNVHYTDSPPEHGDYEVVRGARSDAAGNAPTAAERLERWRAAQEERAARRAEREAAEEQAKQARLQRQEECETARHNLDILTWSNRVILPPEEEGGEPVRMSDDERLRRIEELREAIAEHCE